MSLSPEFTDYLHELFEPLGKVRVRRMFGGAGIFCEDLMFALVAREVLYLKVDDENRAQFEAEGLEAFSYESKGKRVQLSYFRAPDETLDSPALMHPWARSALAAALRSARR